MKSLITAIILTTSLAPAQTLVCSPDAPANVKLAAQEVRRYVYLRTGELMKNGTDGTDGNNGTITLAMNPAHAEHE